MPPPQVIRLDVAQECIVLLLSRTAYKDDKSLVHFSSSLLGSGSSAAGRPSGGSMTLMYPVRSSPMNPFSIAICCKKNFSLRSASLSVRAKNTYATRYKSMLSPEKVPNIVPIHVGAPNEKLEIVEALTMEIIHPSG